MKKYELWETKILIYFSLKSLKDFIPRPQLVESSAIVGF